ncbi:TIGR03960 family B12-binding radical SAM protein [candidate division WOR-3 bacterium]|uniref:TIGR03960 family B12-binding radical SAM protein n=1 Tax=candidate division WOR-3 bacterium TaxID=2052148 RepID=A0A660SKQ3_UNCW3|nr:MAG: TIGR03960 family B12-binding radical SAM protein [candidate division WOR-3 bacterium]
MVDHLLPLVKKPIRYTDHELNLPGLKSSRVRICLAFPDVYEIGMSNLGIRILYHILNRAGFHVERSFAPWTDLGQLLRREGIPWVSLETRTPLKDFDLIGFSIHTELSVTTALYMLDLAQIPIHAEDRGKNDPIIIAGGPVVYNPLPLIPFIDAFVIGDGEEVMVEIARVLEPGRREENLSRLAQIEGVYVPAENHGRKIKKRTITHLKEEDFPMPPLLPICELTHDRLAIEVARGCLWGCRFCQAGFVNRPLRNRNPDEILRLAERGVRKTGWEEVSLLAFSILDYPGLSPLLEKLSDSLSRRGVGISLPSIRGELLTDELLMSLSRVRRSGLTFAPETGSSRLRKIINKEIEEERIFQNLKKAYELGWRQVKFYFMVGLPGETDEDVDELIRMIKEIGRMGRRRGVKVSIAPFVPKPHTPFQWAPLPNREELMEKINRIRGSIRRSNVKITYHNPELSWIESIIARGDERLAPVLETVYQKGGHFEDWSEYFSIRRWREAFEENSYQPVPLKEQTELPWDFIDVGIDKDFLKREWIKAKEGKITENCRLSGCQGCGACDGKMEKETEPLIHYRVEVVKRKPVPTPVRYRLKYTVGEAYRFASHLDITRAIYRTFRRSDLPVAFSQGFNPHPRVSFGPPKPVGVLSQGEYLDFRLNQYYFGNIIAELNSAFPPDLRAVAIRPIRADIPSLTDLINIHHYVIEGEGLRMEKLSEIKSSDKIILERKKDSSTEYIDIKPDIFRITYNGRLELYLFFGKWRAKLWEVINYLYGREMMGRLRITRIDQMILSKGKLYSPLNL